MSVLWYVKLSDGDVAPLTLEGIDEAFQAGSIDRDTMVLAPGSTQWARLAELAGLDEPAPRPQTTEPSPLPGSLRPFSVDLGAEDATGSDLKPARGKAKWLFAAALVASVFGAAAFEARRADPVSVGRVIKTFALVTIGHTASPSAAAASPPASPSPVTAAPAPENAPVQTAADTAAPGAASPKPTVMMQAAAIPYNALTDLSNRVRPDQVAASQKHEHFAKAHPKVHAASMMVSGSKSKSQGFTTGGNKFDPLNATIP
jgi:GYF domain 2